MKPAKVAVVGATGAVGRTLLSILEERRFALERLTLLATSRSAGDRLTVGSREIAVQEVSASLLEDHDYVFFSAGTDAAKRWAPVAVERGATVIDNSYAFRMDPAVPLVVPEVNAHRLEGAPRLIANPNCSTIQLVLVLAPLAKRAGITRVVVSTYQSVSGTGLDALAELEAQVQGGAEGKEPKPAVYPHPIAFNVLPQIDDFVEGGYTREERKLVYETRKILELPALPVSATTARVPVRVGHSAAVNLSLGRPVSVEEARRWLAEAPGVAVMDDPTRFIYPTPRQAAGRDEAFVGRIRLDDSQPAGLDLWISCDNLRKGAALNAVQIAEELERRRAAEPSPSGAGRRAS
ncbi:MAG TPA: aspartate-semialdehyde dehydrogenase [Candidatus Eisenbacteria bacterium]|nr:aspartate-semialdehyde dehydrogenase [Candidatus Eisenbacteria bacterium]